MNVVEPEVVIGNSPLLLSQPHGGLSVPDSIYKRLNQTGRELADTDWHIARLYDQLVADTSIVRTSIHRYVIDVNRDPAGHSLYPDANTTELCPLTTFDNLNIYRPGQEPSNEEIQARQVHYHQPYHDALQAQIERIKQKHGFVIIYDCHSIRSSVPFLFDGQLPIFNIGTNDSQSCSPQIETGIEQICKQSKEYDYILNGRFKGGWITRHYGKPEIHQHAIQMELAQRAYMLEQAPWTYETKAADKLRLVLQRILEYVIIMETR